MGHIYDDHLGRHAANFAPLSPLSFFLRARDVYPHRIAVRYGELTFTWAECYQRAVRVASALTGRGIGRGDTVAILAANIPEMFEAHFAIPMTGAVLNAINIRLDAATVRFILEHAEAKAFLVDKEFGPVAEAALSELANPPLVIAIDDPTCVEGSLVGELTDDALLNEGDPDATWTYPSDEWDAITLNYTSGTTGNPKGVV